MINRRIARYWAAAILHVLALIPVGCSRSDGLSRSGGFYSVPEHNDLGVIHGHTAIAEFEIVNRLSRPVKIVNTYPSCQCTAVKLSKNPIPAGQSATLRAEADLSQRTGKQELSVMLVTDNAQFPTKRVSFTAWAQATGARRRQLSIGSFYPGAKLNLEVPVSSFAHGTVELIKRTTDGHNMDIVVDLIQKDEKTVLAVSGYAPRAVGRFSKTLHFRESFPGEPRLGHGTVDVDLLGRVTARWNVKPDWYAGFFSLSKGAGLISLNIERNPASHGYPKAVSGVSAKCREDWISLTNYSASSDRIQMRFKINKDKLGRLGAVHSAVELTIEYSDGDVESYTFTLFARIDG